MTRETVGFIGTGLMGAPMASRLLEQGFPLVVYNRTREKAEHLGQRGARVADHPAQVAQESDWVCLMLEDADAVLAVLDQENGLAQALDPKKTVINFGTIGVAASHHISHRIESTGAHYLDAPVLGSVAPAGSGELIIFAGGDEETASRCRHLLDALGRKIFFTGPLGSASAVKLVANMLLARYVEALGEVFALCRGLAVDPHLMLQIMQASALSSPMWEKGEMLLKGPVPLHFPLHHMVKDLGLLDEEVERLGLALPAQEAVYGTFLEALLTGGGERDYSEVAHHFLNRARPA